MGNKDTLVSSVVNGDTAVSGAAGGARASLVLPIAEWKGSEGSVDDDENWNGIGVLYESHVGGVRGGCVQVCSSAFLASFALGIVVAWGCMCLCLLAASQVLLVGLTLTVSHLSLHRQRIWDTMRRKPLTLRGIDSLFAVVEDPTHFFTLEIYKKAKLATAMAIITW